MVPVPEVSPGSSEIRVVLGVQLAAPRQVSRTKTWVKLVFDVVAADLVVEEDASGDGLCASARNATNLPDELTEGLIASVPTSDPSGSVEMS